MLFVTLLKVRSGTKNERGERRRKWKYPDGVRVVGEYILAGTDPEVIVVFEANTINPIINTLSSWDDVFDIVVSPASYAEDLVE